MTETATHRADRLAEWLSPHRKLIVAFSGGVDSSVVAAAAVAADRESVVLITSDSPSVPRSQIDLARQIAGQLEARHVVLPTRETENRDYISNDSQRCYHCKSTLYQSIQRWVETESTDLALSNYAIASGTNADDLGDFRPGIDAGRSLGVLTPLADLGYSKSDVRELARYFGLPNHDVPASPCLASRIAYGVEVTPDRLRRIELAETHLRQAGFREFRVRLHGGDLARIEVARDELERLCRLDRDGQVSRRFRELGFRYVTIDMEGFRSGNLNSMLVSIQSPSRDQEGEAVT